MDFFYKNEYLVNGKLAEKAKKKKDMKALNSHVFTETFLYLQHMSHGPLFALRNTFDHKLIHVSLSFPTSL